jgi:transposase
MKYRVKLTESERGQLLNIARRGKSSARKVKRALILCKADEGLSDQEIAQSVYVGTSTVGRVRKRFVEEGLESALIERPRPGQRRKLTGNQEAHMIAIGCTDAPEGHTHWTLQLLADKVVELEFASSISLETVRQLLKKTNSSPGRTMSGPSPR